MGFYCRSIREQLSFQAYSLHIVIEMCVLSCVHQKKSDENNLTKTKLIMYMSSVNLSCYTQNLLCRQKISLSYVNMYIHTYIYAYVCIYIRVYIQKQMFIFRTNILAIQFKNHCQYRPVFTENIRNNNSTVRILLYRKTLRNTRSIIKPYTILSLYALSWFQAHPFFNFLMQLLLCVTHCL